LQAALEQPNNEAAAVPIIERALDLGVNYIDTSSIYGGPERWSEQYVGKVMAHRRNEAFLATKTRERTRDGSMRMIVDFDVATDPNTDLILSQMRQTQSSSQLPSDVAAFGVTVQKQLTAPLMLIALYSPHGTYDSTFLANYAYININDRLTRSPGIASATMYLGLYKDMAGSPGALAATVSTSTVVTPGGKEMNVVPPVSVTAGTYWILGVWDSVASFATNSATTVTWSYASYPFAILPATAPTNMATTSLLPPNLYVIVAQ